MPKTNRNNRLLSHPAGNRIISEYNQQLKQFGKVNASKFYREYIEPHVTHYSLSAWQNFLKRFETEAGLMAAKFITELSPPTESPKEDIKTNLMTIEVATQRGIQAALHVGAQALQELVDYPERFTPKERAELLFKAMKSQDSRMGVIGKVRKDLREQELMDKAFGSEAYG